MTVYSISFNITLFFQNKIGQIMYLLDVTKSDEMPVD